MGLPRPRKETGCDITFSTTILKSLVVPVIWLALINAIYSQIAPFFALNRIFFPANEEATLKTKQPIRFQGLFKVTDQIAGKWKIKSTMWQILQLLFPKLLLFPPQKWMNLISDRLSTASMKYLKCPSPVFGRFQNGCNKVVINLASCNFGLKSYHAYDLSPNCTPLSSITSFDNNCTAKFLCSEGVIVRILNLCKRWCKRLFVVFLSLRWYLL